MGSSQSSLIPGGGTEGYHILKVQENSPGEAAGLEAFFDFIITIGSTRLDQDNEVLKTVLSNNIGKEIKLTVYSSKTQSVRELNVIPSNDWGGHGTLGVSIRFCSFEGAYENVWHILEVHSNSPAEQAGLRAFSDYIIGSDSVLHESEDLFTLIEAHEGRPLKLYVYNTDDDLCREVTIVPNSSWSGEGSLGCGIGYGYLHRIPIRNALETNSEKKRKTSNIPNPPVIKPSVFPPQNQTQIITNEPPKDFSNSFLLVNDVDKAKLEKTITNVGGAPLIQSNSSVSSHSTIISTNHSLNQSQAPPNNIDNSFALTENRPVSIYTQTTTFDSLNVPLNFASGEFQPPTTVTCEIPFYPVPTYPPMLNSQIPMVPQQLPTQSTFTNISNSIPPTYTSISNSSANLQYISTYPTSISSNPQHVPAYSTSISSYFSGSTSSINAGLQSNAFETTTSSEFNSFKNLNNSQNKEVIGGHLPPQSVSVTTPISIPGMPPITVSATLPYSAVEGLKIDPLKSVTSSNNSI
ncbi:hypothetical protein PGB90_006199 [Kerria lacca]